MKKFLIILLIFSSIQLFSQEKTKKFDFKFGTGIAHFNDDENLCISFENEINYKLNKYFSNSISVNYGKNVLEIESSCVSSYILGSLNIFFSPLKNNKKNDLKIGTGYSYIKYNKIYHIFLDPESFINPELSIHSQFTLKHDKLSLLNLIIEYNYLISHKYLIGLNSYSRFNNKKQFIDIGLMLKLGIVL